MLILIAESKTMTPCADNISGSQYSSHTPMFDSQADSIMENVAGMSVDDISRAIKISHPMALRMSRMAYDFPDKTHGSKAVTAYTGVVFKAFSYDSLSPDIQAEASTRIRIISSLYGWLRPEDIVKPYRLDFTTPLAPDGTSFAVYWRPYVTDALISCVRDGGFRSILDLLPADASRSIDWKSVSTHASVWKADFREIREGGSFRTPDAGFLKTLRGRLLRHIVTDRISDPLSLFGIESDSYCAEDSPSAPGRILFTAAR